jgi:hypothetical protein
MKSLVVLICGALLFLTSTARAGDFSAYAPSEEKLIEDVKTFFDEGGIRAEERFSYVQASSLIDWPVKVKQGLYSELWKRSSPLVLTAEDLEYFIRFSTGYQLEGSLTESFTLGLEGAKVYAALYAFKGLDDRGHEESWNEYFFFDAEGRVLSRAVTRN